MTQNTLTVVQYELMTDEFTVHLKNEDTRQQVPAQYFYERWEEHRNGEKLGHFDTAIAQLYDQHFEEDPTDLCDKSIDF